MSLYRILALPVLIALMLGLRCAPPTALTVTVYSEVACSKGSAVAMVGATSVAGLSSRAPSSVSTVCDSDGNMGNVVVVPATSTDETVAFALMQRADGQPADGCLDPSQASACIVAKRQLRFQKYTDVDMRVDLRLSCLGVACPVDQTCVQGTCVDVCGASCDPPLTGLIGLTVSTGTLSPAFNQATLAYGVNASVASLGLPFTVTPTYTSGYSVNINGAPVASGSPSPVIPLAAQTPTPVDVAVTSGDGQATTHYAIVVPPLQEAYAKASNPGGWAFGTSVSLSGETLAVGAPREPSNATGVNGNQSDASEPNAGAVYVFTRSGTTWSQQAYIKASNTLPGANFGSSVALSGDTLAVSAQSEASNATGINGNQANVSAGLAGAVYVFARTGTTWSQQAYVKASNTRSLSLFGAAIALDTDTLVVSAIGENSGATGVNGNQADTSAPSAGAAYVFTRSGTTWSQQAYLKASNTKSNLGFGASVAVSGDTIAVGTQFESSSATGINGNQADTSAPSAGAVYVFTRTGTAWSQQAYVKASNTATNAEFGGSVALSADTLAVGATGEASGSPGVNGNQGDTSAMGAGAAYVFIRTGTTWAQQAYIKASHPVAMTAFGTMLALNGNILAVSSPGENSSASGVDGNESDQSLKGSGAVYLFARSSAAWSQYAYVKATNPHSNTDFGVGTGLSLSADTLAVGSWGESSNASGINGNENDTSASGSGAVYVLR